MRACLLFLANVFWWGCKPRPPDVAVGRILLDIPKTVFANDADRESLRTAIAELLQKDGSVRYRPNGANARGVVRLELHAELDENSDVLQRMTVDLSEGEGQGQRFTATRTCGSLGVAGLVEDFKSAWRTIAHQRLIAVASDSELEKAIVDAERDVQLFAIERAGEKKNKAMVPSLMKLVQAEEQPVTVLRAVGALVAIGDRRAVPTLIDLTKRKDPLFIQQIIFALARLGGSEVEGYLVTMASGHPDELIQKAAGEALAEMKKKAK